jgi:hypothetical protein
VREEMAAPQRHQRSQVVCVVTSRPRKGDLRSSITVSAGKCALQLASGSNAGPSGRRERAPKVCSSTMRRLPEVLFHSRAEGINSRNCLLV